jgi:hypothetical protein
MLLYNDLCWSVNIIIDTIWSVNNGEYLAAPTDAIRRPSAETGSQWRMLPIQEIKSGYDDTWIPKGKSPLFAELLS